VGGSGDRLIGMILGICILLYLIYLLTGKKLFGNLVADLSQMVIDIFVNLLKGIFRGLKNIFFPKSRGGKRKRKKHGRKRRRNRLGRNN